MSYLHIYTEPAIQLIDLLAKETPDFISPTAWPPISPDLNLMDYKIWSIMQETVYSYFNIETSTSCESALLNRGITPTSL